MQAGGNALRFEIHVLILFGTWTNCHSSGRNLLFHIFRKWL